jgi:NADH-quinone oxidoreductase subunit K
MTHNKIIENLSRLRYDATYFVSNPEDSVFDTAWEPILWNMDSTSLYLEQNIINLLTLISLGYLIFFIGFLGLLVYKGSLIFCLISIELMLISLNFAIIFIGIYIHVNFTQIFVFILLTLAAAETAIGLVLILFYHKLYTTTSLQILNKYKY